MRYTETPKRQGTWILPAEGAEEQGGARGKQERACLASDTQALGTAPSTAPELRECDPPEQGPAFPDSA